MTWPWVGGAISQLVVARDRRGRRQRVLIDIGMRHLISRVCTLASDIATRIGLRVAQGFLGAAANRRPSP